MTTILQLRARALRYRELAGRYDGDAGAALCAAADEIERQVGALEAHEAAARRDPTHGLTLGV